MGLPHELHQLQKVVLVIEWMDIIENVVFVM